MNCPECKTPMKVQDSYTTGAGRASSAECARCDKRFTLITVIACEADAYGKGAYAVAQKLKRGVPARDLLE